MRRVIASLLPLLAALVMVLLVVQGVAGGAPRGEPRPLTSAVKALQQAASAPGGDVLLSTFEYLDYDAAVAYNENANEFLVVWSHQGNIYGQRYNAQGVPQGQNFVINQSPNGKYSPSVAYALSADVYLVVWQDYRNHDTTAYDIYGQLVDANGTLLGGDIEVYIGAGNQENPDVAFDGSSFFVVWQGQYQDDSLDVVGRFVETDGDVLLAKFVLGGSGHGISCLVPAVAFNATMNEYLVVFRRGELPTTQVYGRRITPAGVLPGGEYLIASADDIDTPDIASAAWGAYVVVWSDRRNGVQWEDVYGQVVLAGADSSFDGVAFPISTAVNGQTVPAIAHLPAGGFLVAWQDTRNGSVSGQDIYGQRLLDDGNLSGLNFPVNAADGDQRELALAAGDLYFIAWETWANGFSDIYNQRVAANGSLLWYATAVSARPGHQQSVAVAYNGDDSQYLAAWVDEDGSTWVQRLDADGAPLEEPWPLDSDGFHHDPVVAYNSTQRHYLVIWTDYAYDVIEGRRVYPAGAATVYVMIPGSGDGFAPDIVYDESSDGYLVVWESGGNIYGRTLERGGIAIGNVIRVNEGGTSHQPRAVFDSDHQRFLVVWEETPPGGSHVYGRLLETNGTPIGAKFCVASCSDAVSRSAPAVAYNPSTDRYLVVYEYSSSGGEADIYGQMVEWNGAPSGSELAICTDGGTIAQGGPDVAYASGLQRYYVVWHDGRNNIEAGFDLYSRWVESNGSMATAILPAFRYPGNQLQPSLAYDPDHERGLVAWTDSRRLSKDVYARVGALDTTPPTARFLRTPMAGLAGSTFLFNAWPSTDNLTPIGALAVRWDWTGDGSWDMPWSQDKIVTITVATPGVYTVSLQVRDMMWLTDTTHRFVYVLPVSSNTPPTANLTVDPLVGAAGANFEFDASGSTDAESGLEARWDWDYDGVYDTAFSASMSAVCGFAEAGLHVVRVEVRDAGGLTDVDDCAVLILPGTPVTLDVQPWAVHMGPGENVYYVATAWDGYGNRMAHPSVTWSVLNARAGVIDANGVFTASIWPGTYADVVRAEVSGLSDTATVTIVYAHAVYLPLVSR